MSVNRRIISSKSEDVSRERRRPPKLPERFARSSSWCRRGEQDLDEDQRGEDLSETRPRGRPDPSNLMNRANFMNNFRRSCSEERLRASAPPRQQAYHGQVDANSFMTRVDDGGFRQTSGAVHAETIRAQSRRHVPRASGYVYSRFTVNGAHAVVGDQHDNHDKRVIFRGNGDIYFVYNTCYGYQQASAAIESCPAPQGRKDLENDNTSQTLGRPTPERPSDHYFWWRGNTISDMGMSCEKHRRVWSGPPSDKCAYCGEPLWNEDRLLKIVKNRMASYHKALSLSYGPHLYESQLCVEIWCENDGGRWISGVPLSLLQFDCSHCLEPFCP